MAFLLLVNYLLLALPGSTTCHHSALPPERNHAFYLSVIEIAYPVEDGHTALHLKVFSDDLQNAISIRNGNIPVSITSLCGDTQELAVSYMKEHLLIVLDEDIVMPILRGCRQEGDSHWLTFEIGNTAWTHLDLSADFFMELFPTQTHMVSVTHGDAKRFMRLTQNKKHCQFSF